ncbi:MAG TPA: hypothetical protein VFU16_03410 [Solirubrobacterales bacterium]|nr:hypothetical protein [Solirubrobacterales bacterium]
MLLLAAVFAPAPAAGYEFKSLSSAFSKADGSGATEAGTHPDSWTAEFAGETTVNEGGFEVPTESLKALRVNFPPGLVAAPEAVPRCPRLDLLAEACAETSVIGSVAFAYYVSDERIDVEMPLYNLEPQLGVVAELGFLVERQRWPGLIQVGIDPDPPHGLEATLTGVPQVALIYGASITLRGRSGDDAIITLPRRCGRSLDTVFQVAGGDDVWSTEVAPALDPLEPSRRLTTTICGPLGFSPTIAIRPTSRAAGSASGLDVGLDAPNPEISSAPGIAEADIRAATVELPDGLTLNPSIAEGLGACSPSQLEAETLTADPGQGCPDAAKIGTVEARTPLLADPIPGSLFVAQPDDPATGADGAENPFDAMLALYAVLRDRDRGILFKQPIEVEVDPADGHLTATVGELPEFPLSHLALHLRAGPRSPLTTPPRCGERSAAVSLSPSSGALPLRRQVAIRLDANCADAGFAPRLSAGVTNPQAGAPSPFVLSLTREDGDEGVREVTAALAPGLTARFGSVPICGEAEVASGSCPAASRVGFARVAAGSGQTPAWFPSTAADPGSVYLAGPYRGAPFSLAIQVPAVAGPFDFGDVTVRAAIHVDPRTAEAEVRFDPLPQMLAGVPISYRVLRVVIDRPGFTHNPTSCAPARVQATVRSGQGAVARPSDRFQVGNCDALPFRPRVSVGLIGAAHRGAHPAVRTGYFARSGEAALRRVAVTLPGSLLLDHRRIGAVCSRRQFATSSCPPGSAYGHARAWTPLLARPVEGPVYLRESDGKLPSLAVALRGEVDFELLGLVDSVDGRIRTAFRGLPDIPLSKLVLTIGGGRRGLFVNSGGVCRERRAKVALRGQNDRSETLRPLVRAMCGRR